jgi:ATP-binding cassette, subfamily B, bacterial MsbA
VFFVRSARKSSANTPSEHNTLPLLKRLWREAMRPHKGGFALVLALVALVSGATGLYPVLIKLAFDAFSAKDPAALTYGPFLVILITSVKGFSLLGLTVLTNRIVTRIETDLQKRLYAHLITADLAQLGHENPAALTQRFTTDFAFIREALTRLSTVLLRETATILALIGAMLWIDWQLTLIAAGIAPFLARPIARIGKKLRHVATSTQEEIGAMAGLVSESLAGIRIAKTYALEPYLKTRANSAFERIRSLKMKAANARGRLDPLLEVGGGFAVAAVLLLVGYRIVSGEGTVGDFTGFVSALLIAAQPIRALGNLHAIVQEASAALKRTFTVLDEAPLLQDRQEAGLLTVREGEIRFDLVSFRYREDIPALEEISLCVAGGARVALVGRSGSGKSSLLSLVPRLYEVTNGAITIDGQDIRTVTMASLRAQIAVVSQDAVLFDDTIRANIAFGDFDADEDAIRLAAEHAAAWDFIQALPEGLETRVGPAGGRLSGGERQRIALARAFLKNAPILLLDEATSALDAESEHLVQGALNRLMQGRTTLVIAHRLSTIRDADLIAVMEQGRIVEMGTHADLLSQNGFYARLNRLQFENTIHLE